MLPITPTRPLTRSLTIQVAGPRVDFSIEAPTFILPLLTTIVPSRAVGSGTPTFTRATTATVADHEGVLRTVPAGCARMQGARFVRNLLTGSSEDITNAAWSKVAMTAASSGATLAGLSATRLTLTGGNTGHYLESGSVRPIGVSWSSVAVDVSGLSTKYVLIAAASGGNCGFTWTGPQTITVAATGTAAGAYKILGDYQAVLYASATTTAVGSFVLYVGAYGNYNGDGQYIDVTRAMVVDVTGASIQTPPEYVSVGVLSAPYHGAGADGCKYFGTLNGNTVTNNVVTEATGAAIADATLDGYLAEGARTNVLLHSDDFTGAAWASNGTTTQTANTVTDTDATVSSNRYQDITIANDGTQRAALWHVGKSAANIVALQFQVFGGTGVNYAVALDTTTGAYNTASTLGTAPPSIIVEDKGTYWRVNFPLTNNSSGNVTARFCFLPAYAATLGGASGLGNNTTGDVTRTGVATCRYMGVEAGSFASSYIPTTTAAVTRNADVLTYVSAGNIGDTAGSVIATVKPAKWSDNTRVVGSGNGVSAGTPLCIHAGSNSSGVSGYDTTTPFYGPAGVPSGASKKIASKWGNGTMAAFVGGLKGTPVAYDGSWNLTGGIGIGIGGNVPMFGAIRNLRIYSRALPDSTLQGMTT